VENLKQIIFDLSESQKSEWYASVLFVKFPMIYFKQMHAEISDSECFDWDFFDTVEAA
jgi:hypothetical protein